MTDVIKKIGNSVIQYGKENDRIYLMKLSDDDFPEILPYMNNLVANEGFSKILAKVPSKSKEAFLKDGYETEALVKGFFNGEEDCFFVSKYFSDERKFSSNVKEEDEIIKLCTNRTKVSSDKELDKKYHIKKISKRHIGQAIDIYKEIFETYPFPIHDIKYIEKTMDEHIDYFGVFEDDKILAVSSSEMDLKNKNSEMTDFAALSQYHGSGFAYFLLKEMEKSTKAKGIKTFYTIARSKNIGMNMTFAKNGYTFGGKLVNNTNICGKIESMNVWFKPAQKFLAKP
jgi:putative beta-lysine N-acetyltransferase